MNKSVLFLLNLLTAVSLAAQTTGEPSAQACALITMEGKVEVARRGTAEWVPATRNQTLELGDRLRTKLRSRATLQWSDLSTLRVDQLSTIEIQRPSDPGQKPGLELKSGASYFFSRENPNQIEFRTPSASGAIRGTEFNLALGDEGETIVTLLDGEVDLANAEGAVTLSSGEQGIAAAGRPPQKTAVLDAASVIQWALYYPAVVDVDELDLTSREQEDLSESIDACRAGDLLEALRWYPEDRQPQSDAERVLFAALLLSVGQVSQTEEQLSGTESDVPAARALRELIQVVRGTVPAALAPPATASEWMARSYSLQATLRLDEALRAAQQATALAPGFGAAWVRTAELEFSFGRRPQAERALATGLELSDRNAQGLVLRGFLAGARNQRQQALDDFQRAIEVDGALGNAWLGRGLIRFSQNRKQEGREDLQVAATLEPNRSALRSYLGKAFAESWDPERAAREFDLAERLDPNDPTPWLYSALLDQQRNRINSAISDLEHSKTLNDNRAVFRSGFLLDQDRAVRNANLASIYQDAGLFDFSVQEAARAVNYDYANASAHLFLANSYDALRDPNLFNLRYETPWFSEQLLANLLAPVGGGNLSPTVSQQEYSRFFAGNNLGVFSSTEYLSNGDWVQQASQFGTIDNTGYSLDVTYRSLNGWRPNNDLEDLNLGLRLKQQITDKDSVYFEAGYVDRSSGDLAQYYDQGDGSDTLRITERQSPNLLLGYHREWSPGNHTLVLGGRFDDKLKADDPSYDYLWNRVQLFPPYAGPQFTGYTDGLTFERDLDLYSAEIQQIYETSRQSLIVGARYQSGTVDTSNQIDGLGLAQSLESSLDRAGVYAYENFKVLDNLILTAGLSYDYIRYPESVGFVPVESSTSKDQISPKAGIVWSPWKDTHLRFAYTRSLGGLYFDNSVRLEPVQVAGFNQAFRSLLPESFGGSVPGTRFETLGLGLDQKFETRTYLNVSGELLWSDGTRAAGALTNDPVVLFPPVQPTGATSFSQDLDYRESSLLVAANQLAGDYFAFGARYRLTYADLTTATSGLTPATPEVESSAFLHRVSLDGQYTHPCGFFAQLGAIWTQQSNRESLSDQSGDEFWHLNAFVGYRFLQRRVEARVGVVNITDQDYNLNPLTLYSDLPRDRSVFASLKFYF
jgi:hypothetical protein